MLPVLVGFVVPYLLYTLYNDPLDIRSWGGVPWLFSGVYACTRLNVNGLFFFFLDVTARYLPATAQKQKNVSHDRNQWQWMSRAERETSMARSCAQNAVPRKQAGSSHNMGTRSQSGIARIRGLCLTCNQAIPPKIATFSPCSDFFSFPSWLTGLRRGSLRQYHPTKPVKAGHNMETLVYTVDDL